MNNNNEIAQLRIDFTKFFNENNFNMATEIGNKIVVMHPKEDKGCEHAIDLYNISLAHQKLNRYQLTIKLCKKVLKIVDKKIFNINSNKELQLLKLTIDTHTTMAINYSKSTARLSFAINHFEEAYDITHKYLPRDTYYNALCLYNLGSINQDIQNYDNSIKYLIDCISIRDKKDIDYMDTLNMLAYAYEELGKYDKAISYLEEAFTLCKGICGINSKEYTSSLFYISSLYYKNGDYDKSIKNYEEVITIIEQEAKENDTYLPEIFVGILKCYIKKNDIITAIEIQNKCLNLIKQVIGTKHIFYVTNLKYLADMYFIIDDYQNAILSYELEEEIRKDVIGIYNEDYVMTLLNLINLYIKTGDDEKNFKATDFLVKMVDFDLSKPIYTKAILSLAKIYIENDSEKIHSIYDYYKNIDALATFDDMIKLANKQYDDITNKENKTTDMINFFEDSELEEEDDNEIGIEEDIFGTIKDLFDSLKSADKHFNQVENNEDENDENDDTNA